MTILQQEIIRLRKEGKTYTQIQKILKCSKGTIAYNCSDMAKQNTKKRCERYSSEKGALYKKLQGYCYNYGKKSKKRKNYPLLNLDEVKKKLGDNPICYLTGESIDISDMKKYSLDHIIPLSKGGKSTLKNLGLTTKEANQAKSDLTKEEFLSLCVKVLQHNSYRVEKI
jgi:CRISPR/Cas system Type II protein with McrA/HNH and RuvC-like nuclease domain